MMEFSPESHALNVSIATVTGSVNSALIFNHIFFWLKTNKSKNRHQIDGRTWMYESIPNIALHFPYLSEQQIKDGLSLLVKHGYLVKGKFSENKFDHTLWYALSNEEWLGFQKKFPIRSTDPIDQCPETRSAESTDPIRPYIYTDNNTDNKDIAQTAAQSSQSAHSASPIRSSKVPEIIFCFVKEKFENITQKDYDTWKTLYPAVDIDREITEMIEWIKENPSKAKSKKLWRKFIRGWLQRQNEKLTNKQAYQAKNKQQNSVLERHTGFQKDTRPPNPKRIRDYSQWDPKAGAMPVDDSP